MKLKNFTTAQKEALINVIRVSLGGGEYGQVEGRLANVLHNTKVCTFKDIGFEFGRTQKYYVTGVDYNKLMLHPQGLEIMQEAKDRAMNYITVWSNEDGIQQNRVEFKVGDEVDFIGYYGTSKDNSKWYNLESRKMEEALKVTKVRLGKYGNGVYVTLSNGFEMMQSGYVAKVWSKCNALVKSR